MSCWHLTYSSDGRHALFPDEVQRRTAVRKLAACAGDSMALFCVVDDHVHIVLLAKRAVAGRLTQSLLLALRPLAEAPMGRGDLRPVETRAHLEWLVPYVLRQVVLHGLAADPALWSGSCFQDLVGARFLQGLRLRIYDALPRFKLRTAYEAVGLSAMAIRPAPDEAVRAAGAARLVAAAASALAADPALPGKQAPVTQARVLAAHLSHRVGGARSDLVWALRITPSAAARLLKRQVPDSVLRAARVRLALEDAVHGRVQQPQLGR